MAALEYASAILFNSVSPVTSIIKNVISLSMTSALESEVLPFFLSSSSQSSSFDNDFSRRERLIKPFGGKNVRIYLT